jgi:hypothetical protein
VCARWIECSCRKATAGSISCQCLVNRSGNPAGRGSRSESATPSLQRRQARGHVGGIRQRGLADDLHHGDLPCGQKLDGLDERHVREVHRQVDGAASAGASRACRTTWDPWSRSRTRRGGAGRCQRRLCSSLTGRYVGSGLTWAASSASASLAGIWRSRVNVEALNDLRDRRATMPRTPHVELLKTRDAAGYSPLKEAGLPGL